VYEQSIDGLWVLDEGPEGEIGRMQDVAEFLRTHDLFGGLDEEPWSG
jgi:hypothetical protein